jgi:hypothetical protein
MTKSKSISSKKKNELSLSATEQNTILGHLIEKQNWLKFVAPRLSSLFVEQTKQEVKQDTTLNIKWESEPDLIDVSADTVSDTSDSKDL